MFVMDDDGSNVTSPIKMEARLPTWSPDGRRIAFISTSHEKINGYHSLQVYAVDSDGSNLTLLTRNPKNSLESCWSPEGTKIVFVMGVDKIGSRVNIFQVDSHGGNVMRLTAGPVQDRRPSLSPDGSKLAFQSNRDGNYEIYVMNLRND
jgi:Tol biopolymer transport system component